MNEKLINKKNKKVLLHTFFLTMCIIMSVKVYSQANNIKTVVIGKQLWMAENLNVDKFRNGDPIPQVKTNKEWEKFMNSKKPAWCYYENKKENGLKYGKLYNWYAVNDSRGLAPKGWHIPNKNEMEQMIDYLGGDKIAGEKLKNNTGWIEKGNGTNLSGFSALPAGTRTANGFFDDIGETCGFWTTNQFSEDKAMYQPLSKYSFADVIEWYKNSGVSVRCVNDDELVDTMIDP